MEQRLNIEHYKYQDGKFLDHSDVDYYFGVQFERRHCQCIWYESILLKSQYYIYFQYGWMCSVRSTDVRVNFVSKKVENTVSRALVYWLILSAFSIYKIINESIHYIDWICLINTTIQIKTMGCMEFFHFSAIFRDFSNPCRNVNSRIP